MALFILTLSCVVAEEDGISINLTATLPGKDIFYYLIASDIYQNVFEGEVYSYHFTLKLKRELDEEEINGLVQGMPLYKGQLRGTLNTMNYLLHEKNRNNAKIVQNLSLNDYGVIVGGEILFRDSGVGNLIAKREPQDIQVHNALINFSERKIYVYNRGYFSVYDSKTKAWYFYEAYDEPYEKDMKIIYVYNKLGSFWLDAPNTQVRIFCYLPGDDFCSYTNYFIDQGQDFALNIRDFTRISGIFNYTWIYNSFLIKKNSSGSIVAGVKLPLVKRFIYSSYFDLRSKSLEFLVSEAENKYLFCYGKIDGKLHYSLAKECEFKIIDEGLSEIGISTEIQTKNVKILQPANKEELLKIIEILKS